MVRSTERVLASKSETSDENCFRALKEHQAFRKLTELEPKQTFNLFRLFEDVFSENCSSRFLRFIFDSEESHGMGLAPFRSLTRTLGLESEPGWSTVFGQVTNVQSFFNWATDRGRFLDLLLLGYGSEGNRLFALGIENKLGAPEQANQLRNYQSALTERFREKSAIIFLTPEGRSPMTADRSLPCEIYLLSHAKLSASITELSRSRCGFVPEVQYLLDSYARFMTEEEDPMAKSARELVKNLLSDPECRRAVGLIQSYVPSLRSWLTESFLPELSARLTHRVELSWTYPARSENPYEINLDVGDLNSTLLRKGVLREQPHEGIYFMLNSGRRPATVGDSFDVLVMVHGPSVDRRRTIISALEPLGLPPPTRAFRQWGPWTCLWAGQSYTLQDIGDVDKVALASLVQAAVSEIYPLLVKNL